MLGLDVGVALGVWEGTDVGISVGHPNDLGGFLDSRQTVDRIQM